MKNFISVGDVTLEEKLEQNWRGYSKYVWIVIVIAVGGVMGNGYMSDITAERSQKSADSLYSVINSKELVTEYKKEKDNMNSSDRLMAMYKMASNTSLNEFSEEYVRKEVAALSDSDKENRNRYLSVWANLKIKDNAYKSAIDSLKQKTIMTAIDKMIIGDLNIEMGDVDGALMHYEQSLALVKTEEFKKIVEGRIARLTKHTNK